MRRWPVVVTVLAAVVLTGCATAAPGDAQQTPGRAMTAESANTEQLDLLDALMAAAPASWGPATVNRFRTCSTASGEGGIQITREIRGSGISDERAAARAFRDELTANGFDAEIRRGTEVVGTGSLNRFAAFNADGGASIIQAYSACYRFDLRSSTPTVPATAGD
ncbi:hypothetical protein [Curtobacterium pusillum]|uniref:hypothetical protein n=1 Tax=Curtobacterium pusillum TaxID=69373 RepID=UPI0011A8BD4A|nr:hypothetical protein [Curtobacterium pusillum]